MEPVFNFDKEMTVTFKDGHSRPYSYFWYDEDIVVMYAKNSYMRSQCTGLVL